MDYNNRILIYSERESKKTSKQCFLNYLLEYGELIIVDGKYKITEKGRTNYKVRKIIGCDYMYDPLKRKE